MAHPWALFFLLLLPGLWWLYRRRQNVVTRVVAGLALWQSMVQPKAQQDRAPAWQGLWHRKRSMISMLILATLLLLMITAAVHFRFSAEEQPPPLVVVLEFSGRMLAKDQHGVTLWERAQRMADNLLQQQPESREILLLGFASEAPLLIPGRVRVADARKTINSLAPNHSPPRWPALMQVLNDLSHIMPDAERVIISPSASPDALENTAHLWTATNLPNAYAAITAFAAEDVNEPGRPLMLFLEATSFHQEPTDRRIEIFRDGGLWHVADWTFAPGERKSEALNLGQLDEMTILEARLSPEDQAPLLNRSYAVAYPSPSLRVVLISEGNWLLEQALASDTSVRVRIMSPQRFFPDAVASADVVIIDGEWPAGFDLENFPAVPVWTFGVAPFRLPELERRPASPLPDVSGPAVSFQATDHPVFRNVDILGLIPRQARAWRPEPNKGGWHFEELASMETVPLIQSAIRTDAESKQQRALIQAFGVEESELPIRVAFPVMLQNGLRWLSASGENSRVRIELGRPTNLPFGVAVNPEPFLNPVNHEADQELGVVRWARGHFLPQQAGFYQLEKRGRPSWEGVSPFDKQLHDYSSSEPAPEPVQLPSESKQDSWDLTPAVLALIAMIGLVFEWRWFAQQKTE